MRELNITGGDGDGEGVSPRIALGIELVMALTTHFFFF